MVGLAGGGAPTALGRSLRRALVACTREHPLDDPVPALRAHADRHGLTEQRRGSSGLAEEEPVRGPPPGRAP
jgi:hypothetical protein